MEFLRAARSFRFGSARLLRNNDFFADRLSHKLTTTILLIFIVLVTLKRYFTNPISCWTPAELKRYEKYISKYCWIKGTYYVNQNYDLNVLSIEARDETLLYYYQWVYIFLLIQALLFYFPKVVWHFFSNKILDYDLLNIVDAAIRHECYSNDQKALIQYLSSNLTQNHSYSTSKQIKTALNIRSKLNRQSSVKINENETKAVTYFRSRTNKLRKSLLTYGYIITKLLYLCVAVLQIHLMNRFLSNQKHSFYGWQVIETILKGQADLGDSSDSKVFPRVTICDIKTRELGSDHLYTVQCILTFNLFNERIYAFLWFWISIVVIPFTVIDLAKCLKRFIFMNSIYNIKFVKDRLKVFQSFQEKKDKREKKLMRLFADYYLANDGVFVLRLIEHNSNALVVSDLIHDLWTKFKNEQDELNEAS
jgi:hypothetical protein